MALDDNDAPRYGGGGALSARGDADDMGQVELPKNLRLWN
jgi:hypothetical protein